MTTPAPATADATDTMDTTDAPSADRANSEDTAAARTSVRPPAATESTASTAAEAAPPAAREVRGANDLEFIYAVSDSIGFVGAFPTARAAELAVLREYPGIPFVVQKFPAAPGPADTVWVVLYRDIDAIACVSNVRARAEEVRRALDGVGLAYPDHVDYWEHPLGRIPTHAEERLKTQKRALQMYTFPPDPDELAKLEEADIERLRKLTMPRKDSPIERIIRENELITILDCVVPLAFTAGDEGPVIGAETAAVPGAETAAVSADDDLPADLGLPGLPGFEAPFAPVATRAEVRAQEVSDIETAAP